MQNTSLNNSTSSPLVAIFMVTYNHEKFIEEAIRSVAEQQTNFDFRLFVGEDCSTDNTRAICLRLQEEFPDRVSLILHEKNVGALPNARKVYEACTNSGAEFWAFCEGDDYWTDKTKLQRQVDAMRARPDWGLCFHATTVMNSDGSTYSSELNQGDKIAQFGINDLAKKNFIHTPSLLLRVSAFPGWPVWTPDVLAGDYMITTLIARNHLLGYLPENMAVYRKHDGGMWSSASRTNHALHWIKLLDLLRQEGFSAEVNQIWLEDIEEKLHPIIVELYYSDRKKFTEVMTNFGHRYPGVSKEWLLNRYPSIVSNFENSIWVRIGKKVSGIKSKLMGGPKQ